MKHRKSELNPAIKRNIADKEKDLGRKCRMIWDFTNWKGETFLFGAFSNKDREMLTVTIAYANPYVNGGFVPVYD